MFREHDWAWITDTHKKKGHVNTEILLKVMRYYHSNSISCTDSSLYFTPKSCRSISFIFFFLCLSIYCLYCSKPNGDLRLNVLCRNLTQRWNSIAHLLSALEQLYTCPYLPTNVSRTSSCECWWQKLIYGCTATNEKQKIMSPAYAGDIDIKMHSGGEGRGREETNVCIWDICACKWKNTTALKVCTLRNVMHRSDKHCNADSVHSLTFRGIFHQISIFLYSADGRGKTFHYLIEDLSGKLLKLSRNDMDCERKRGA